MFYLDKVNLLGTVYECSLKGDDSIPREKLPFKIWVNSEVKDGVTKFHLKARIKISL